MLEEIQGRSYESDYRCSARIAQDVSRCYSYPNSCSENDEDENDEDENAEDHAMMGRL